MAKLSDEDRIRLFLRYCLHIEDHPFFKWIQAGNRLRVDAAFPDVGDDAVEVSFDPVHLESFLCRLRQFLSPREAFAPKNMTKAVENVLGSDAMLKQFFSNLERVMQTKLPAAMVEAFKPNGNPVAEGRTALELLEAALYTGAIHSERLADNDSEESTAAWIDAHDFAKGHLRAVLAAISPRIAQNIFALRMHILRRWQDSGRVWPSDELATVEARVEEHRSTDVKPA